MRESFSEFYRPESEWFDALWRDALVVFDTNVLLRLYAYSSTTYERWAQVLQALSERNRLWMPHQVGLEFHRARPQVLFDLAGSYSRVLDQLGNIEDQAKALAAIAPHPQLELAEFAKQFADAVERQRRRVKRAQNRHRLELNDDPIRSMLDAVYSGHVGPPLETAALEALYRSADKRFERLVPPGHGDAKKDESLCDFGVRRPYGDCVIWEQLLAHCESTQHSAILVTDDKSKGDWFWRARSKANLGPHPMLLAEFERRTKRSFYLYVSEDFLKYAMPLLSIEGEDAAIAEVREVDARALRDREALLAGHRIRVAREELAALRRRCDDVSAAAAAHSTEVERLECQLGAALARADQSEIDATSDALARSRALAAAQSAYAADAEARLADAQAAYETLKRTDAWQRLRMLANDSEHDD